MLLNKIFQLKISATLSNVLGQYVAYATLVLNELGLAKSLDHSEFSKKVAKSSYVKIFWPTIFKNRIYLFQSQGKWYKINVFKVE